MSSDRTVAAGGIAEMANGVNKTPFGSGSREVAPAAPVNSEHSIALMSTRLGYCERFRAPVTAPELGITRSISSYAIPSDAFMRSALERSLV